MEERLNTLERKFQAFTRRHETQAGKVLQVQLHSAVLSHYTAAVATDGEVARFLFPTNGAIRRAVVLIPSASTNHPVEVKIKLFGAQNQSVTKIATGLVKLDLDWEVDIGDRLFVYVGDISVVDCETAFLFVPEDKGVRRANFELSILGDFIDERVRAFTAKVSKRGAKTELPKSD